MFSESHTQKRVEYGTSQLPAISDELSLKLNVSEATQEQLAKKSPDNFESCFTFKQMRNNTEDTSCTFCL